MQGIVGGSHVDAGQHVLERLRLTGENIGLGGLRVGKDGGQDQQGHEEDLE